MDFKDYLKKQLSLHPSMQPQDVAKMCCQAARGAEHLLSDVSAAKHYFDIEYEQTPADSDTLLYEEISPSVCRINLGVFKTSGMPPEWLFRMFVHSASVTANEEALLRNYLADADRFVRTAQVTFSYEEWINYLNCYRENNMPTIHHSQIYRDSEKPAYRIVHSRFIKLIPILKAASFFIKSDRSDDKSQPEMQNTICIAIDGRAASGKSTMADDLNDVLCGGLIHLDDFFLPPSLRTGERLSEAGGNVHYERFFSEVLPLLKRSKAFSYRTFDCGKMDYGAVRTVRASKWRIVEGAYSHHPYFGTYADIKVFSDIDADTQMKRLRSRNGEQMAKRFAKEWIPMEENYYEHYQIKEHADIVISN